MSSKQNLMYYYLNIYSVTFIIIIIIIIIIILLLSLTLRLRSVGCNLKDPQRRYVCLSGPEISISHRVLFIRYYQRIEH